MVLVVLTVVVRAVLLVREKQGLLILAVVGVDHGAVQVHQAVQEL